jgi:hypothetical protein
MGLIFNKMKEPVFLKETSNATVQLEQMKNLKSHLNPEGQKIIDRDITCLEYGIEGEKNIAFELKNSHMPIYVLHDIYLENGDLSAQIDYLVFTRKICFVIECKNLFGNITIDNNGNFIRTMTFGTHKIQEGIYSPITQNQRHMELIKKIKVENASNALIKFSTARFFDQFHKSIVVLANPKTILNDRYAKKEIKDQIIRADQLIAYIKEQTNASKEMNSSDEEMMTWAQKYLNLNREMNKEYLQKYEKYKAEAMSVVQQKDNQQKATADLGVCPQCGAKLVERNGKYGSFIGCSNFPKCRYTAKK